MPEFATKMHHLNSTPPLKFGLQTLFPRPWPSTAHILKEDAERGYIAQVGHTHQQLQHSLKNEFGFFHKI